MSLLTRRDKAQIKAQIEESERLVEEEAKRTNAKLKTIITEQAARQRRTANQIENTPKIAEAVRLLELNKEAYLESMNSLKKYIVSLNEKTDIDFGEIHRVIETNKYVTRLVNNRQIDYIKELGQKTPAFATVLYDRYMDARQKIFKFATISIEEDESLLKALAGIQSDSDSRSSRSSSGRRSRGRSSVSSTKSIKSVAETDRLINEIFQLGSILKTASRHVAKRYFNYPPDKDNESTSSIESTHSAVGSLPPRHSSATGSKKRTAKQMRELMESNLIKRGAPQLAKSDASSSSSSEKSSTKKSRKRR